jgi:glycosyltransferase involved in cell wall biosynthesis
LIPTKIKIVYVPNVDMLKPSDYNIMKTYDLCIANNQYNEQKINQYHPYINIFRPLPAFSFPENKDIHVPKSNISNCINFIVIGGAFKNYMNIIKVFYKLVEDGVTNIKLYLTLKDIESDPILKYIDHPNIVKLNFVENHDDIIQLYKMSHVSIILSKHEGLGLNFFESIQTGTPIITHDGYPHSEIVEHDKNGWIVKSTKTAIDDIEHFSFNHTSLFDTIKKISMFDDFKYNNFRENAISYNKTNFDFDKFKESFCKIISIEMEFQK